DFLGGRLSEHDAFQKRIAGHPIGAMQSRKGRFANGVEILQVCLAVCIHHYAATRVMCGGNNRYGFDGDINAICKAVFVNSGEVLNDEVARLVTDSKIYAVATQAFHLMIYGSCHHISRSQFGELMEFVHEALTTWQLQEGPFTP